MIPPRVRARLVFAGKSLFWVVLVMGTFVLVRSARAHQEANPRHLVDLAAWRVTHAADWVSPDDVAEIRATTGLVGSGLPLYDRSAAGVVHAHLRSAPLVRRVVSIRRGHPDRLHVVLELRRPRAAVLVSHDPPQWVEVDGDGVALGGARRVRPTRDGRPLRVVSGAEVSVTRAGEVFGPDVIAAVRLGTDLDATDRLTRDELTLFDEVDVSNFGGRVDVGAPEILLRAATDGPDAPRATTCVVEWGRADADLDEPSAESKRNRLLYVLHAFGPDIDGIERVKVAFEEVVIVPVPGAAASALRAAANAAAGR